MKRIIQGQTYNTDTATAVAFCSWDDPNAEKGEIAETIETLYVTRGGAFFAVTERHQRGDYDDFGAKNWRVSFEALSRSQAEYWITSRDDVELHDDTVFNEPPEAVAEEKATTTLYLRIPQTLKEKVEAAAKGEGLSANAWATNCLQTCAS